MKPYYLSESYVRSEFCTAKISKRLEVLPPGNSQSVSGFWPVEPNVWGSSVHSTFHYAKETALELTNLSSVTNDFILHSFLRLLFSILCWGNRHHVAHVLIFSCSRHNRNSHLFHTFEYMSPRLARPSLWQRKTFDFGLSWTSKIYIQRIKKWLASSTNSSFQCSS